MEGGSGIKQRNQALIPNVGNRRLLMRKLIDDSSSEVHKIVCKNRKIKGNIDRETRYNKYATERERVRHKIKRLSYLS